MDEAGFQRAATGSMAPKGDSTPYRPSCETNKQSCSFVPLGYALGKVFKPLFIFKGEVFTEDMTRAARTGVGVLLQKRTHFMTGGQLVVRPGGVLQANWVPCQHHTPCSQHTAVAGPHKHCRVPGCAVLC